MIEFETNDYINIKNIRLIKVDTEGADLEVLKGASRILDRDSPILITEGIKPDNQFLKDKGYVFKMNIGVSDVNILWIKPDNIY